jgi:hypothetical protein
LRHVKDVEELGTISDVEPHPVSIRLQSDGLESQDLKEVGASSRIPMVINFIFNKYE